MLLDPQEDDPNPSWPQVICAIAENHLQLPLKGEKPLTDDTRWEYDTLALCTIEVMEALCWNVPDNCVIRCAMFEHLLECL